MITYKNIQQILRDPLQQNRN